MFLDERLFGILYGLTHKSQLFDWLIIFLAEYLIFILAFTAAIFILKEKDWRLRFYFFSLTIISVVFSRGIITSLIRFYYERPRPFVAMDITPLIDHAATGSFPSGHMAFIVPIVLTIWLINRRVGIWFLAGALFLGLARAATGIHWPTDILGGALVGTASFLATYYLLKLRGLTSKELNSSVSVSYFNPQPQ